MDDLKADHELVITLEHGVLDGGFGEKIARYYGATDMKDVYKRQACYRKGIAEISTPHGDIKK